MRWPISISAKRCANWIALPMRWRISADPVLILPEDERFYTEKIVRLPYSYMPRDSAVPLGPCPPRPPLGLPATALVFCGFNNTLKFTPEMFAIWMRLLRTVAGSVLWLSSQDAAVRDNLRCQASVQGVDPARIVFADRVEACSDHLARLAAADLFLDTLPYGAHSTANDFLWAGVPVLSCRGRSFATRVAAAMLTALDLPELIAADLGTYEALALDLAQNPARLAALRGKLAAARATTPLFNSTKFCRALETADRAMAERHRAGLSPQSFSVAAPGTATFGLPTACSAGAAFGSYGRSGCGWPLVRHQGLLPGGGDGVRNHGGSPPPGAESVAFFGYDGPACETSRH
jgi:protein O-GlcNAc transferase